MPTHPVPPQTEVASQWAAVADVVAPAPSRGRPAAPGHVPADLSVAMTSFAARRDLRRILIAFGAIGKPRPGAPAVRPARPEDVVGAFITAPPPLIEDLLRSAGAVSEERRIQRFTSAIAQAGEGVDPTDPMAVEGWISQVAEVLRDDHRAHPDPSHPTSPGGGFPS